jgi:hypothetical protein
MAFQGKNHIRYKTVIDNKTMEQVSSFKYLGYNGKVYCLQPKSTTVPQKPV